MFVSFKFRQVVTKCLIPMSSYNYRRGCVIFSQHSRVHGIQTYRSWFWSINNKLSGNLDQLWESLLEDLPLIGLWIYQLLAAIELYLGIETGEGGGFGGLQPLHFFGTYEVWSIWNNSLTNVFIHWCTSLLSDPPLTGWFAVTKVTVDMLKLL